MDVHQADDTDFASCAELSPAVQSSHVWQLRLAYDPTAPTLPEELGGVLSCTRLPRPIAIRPSTPETLETLWARAADVLIAEHEAMIAGYVVITTDEAAGSMSIARLVVAPNMRRSGVGGILLRTALQWGSAFNQTRLLAHCSARNHPAISFYMRYGLRFAGYSEALYPNNEVALFWQRPV